jgi:hypothetical protein
MLADEIPHTVSAWCRPLPDAMIFPLTSINSSSSKSIPMLKKIFLGVVTLSMLYAHSSKAQGRGCGVNPEYFVSKIKYPGGPTSIVVPSSFPVSAIDTCGRFAFYYEDKRIAGLGGPAAGFADATRGAALRSTMCAVVSYIETVFDFSGIDPTEKIRIYVDTSYSSALKPITLDHVPGWGQDYGVGSAFYDGSSGSGVVSGFVEKFIKTGTDPNPGDYHGTLQMNFHRATSWPPIISAGKSGADWYDWSNYYVGTGTPPLIASLISSSVRCTLWAIFWALQHFTPCPCIMEHLPVEAHCLQNMRTISIRVAIQG